MQLKSVGIFILASGALNLGAQSLLSPESAVQLALQQNLEIGIAKNNQKSAEIMKTWGNAGFLPTIQLNGGYTKQSNDLKQKYSSGLLVDRKGVASSNAQAGIGLQWALFDGGRMFTNWHRLQEEAQLAGFAFRNQAEQVVSATLMGYFEIVKLQQQLSAIEAGIETADQQILVSRTRMEAGSGSRQEFLQSQIDLNTWKSLYISQKSQIRTAKIRLNDWLSREPDTEFSVLDSLPAYYTQNDAGESPQDYAMNTSLQTAALNKRLAALTEKDIHAAMYPSLMLNAGYLFGRSQSNGGFALFNQSIGPSAGLGLSWNLFNGGKVKTAMSQVKLDVENAGLAYRSTEFSVKAQIRVTWMQLEDQRQIRALEEQNMLATRENMELALERYKIGKSDIITLKEAQRSYQESIGRVSASRLSVLQAEIDLLRIRGKLIQ